MTVRKRFVFTLGSNLLRALLGFVTGVLLARWLGPNSYGNMSFLLGTFLGMRQVLDLGSSTAFFTFLSQRPRSKRFVNGFFVWMAVQFVVPLCGIGLLFPAAWIATIWNGQPRGLVLLAFAAVFMQNSVWPTIQQAGESQRQTLLVQSLGVLVAVAHIVAVALFWRLGVLGLYAVFAAVALEYLLAAVVAQRRFPHALPGDTDPADDAFGPVVRKYFAYCLPLIPYSVFGFAQEFADRWLLQNYGGGVQQAFYAVGSQFAAVALVATTSILRIFWKEVAEAHHQQDHVRAGMLYRKVSRLLFFVGALIAGFLIPWAADLLRLLLGAAYVGGALTLSIMFLYPVHQSMGQIGGTMLYATEHVTLQVVTGIVFMALGVVVTYFVLAPRSAGIPGLGLASEGLAIKMVAVQFIQVNVVAVLIARIWHWSFDWFYQPVALLGCLALGWLARRAVVVVLGAAGPVPVEMGAGGVLYLAMVAAFVYAMPWAAGLSRAEIVIDVRRVWQGALHAARRGASKR